MPGAWAPSIKRIHAALVQMPHQLFDWKYHRRRAADMVQQRDPRPLGHTRQYRVQDLIGRFDGNGNLRDDDPCATPIGDIAGDIGTGVVTVVGDEDIVACTQFERPQHAVDAGGGVGHEDQVLLVGADQFGQPLA